ncbi:TRAP transporter small permease [Polycladidibacter stylochi]|uniref:TRAP transporter small permease n=1 Tax=Polycladidibacter stylochi TaxID=1807766 RepID=UPI0009EA0AC7|nr:TRAP transporter small permease [Pseudovibrio stylochi]
MKKHFNLCMEILLGSIFVLMLCLTTWQVVSRFILNDPSTFTEEALRFSTIWLVILGSAYATYNDLHFGMTLLTGSLRGMSAKLSKLFTQSVMLVFTLSVFLYGGYQVFISNLSQVSPVLGISIGTVYSVFMISGVLSVVAIIVKLIEIIKE